ncbi:MAG: phosphate/phosphite/phosphonate ABC transporter substrate-binding protein [Gammaproteobacteria bacterium]|nr:phosphate/phosphite/phosphonate ABC transporter substrate-binding protein [Gammaproteobacteria bacterium]
MLRWILLLGCLVSGSIKPVVAADGTPAYSFGVFPYLSAVRLEPIYAPVSAQLSNTLGRDVHFRTASEFNRFFEKLRQQQYDIALIQPFWYPPAVDEFGYLPLVRMREPISALIMLPEDSPITTLDDLRGQTIATPPSFAPVVHMARRELTRRGLEPDRDVFLEAFKSIDSCFQQVLIGRAAACISPPFLQPVIEEKMQLRLRVLMRTSSIPGISLVVHPRIPQQDRQQIEQLFLSLNDNETGRDLLQRMRTGGFIRTLDREYDIVRSFVAEIKADQGGGR